jgi:hypothetical protein
LTDLFDHHSPVDQLAARLVEQMYHLHGNVGVADTPRVNATTGALLSVVRQELRDAVRVHMTTGSGIDLYRLIPTDHAANAGEIPNS